MMSAPAATAFRSSSPVVNLHQGRHAVPAGQLPKSTDFALLQDGGNQQDGVRPMSRRFHDVDFIDGEILSQDGKGHRGPGGFEVGQAALKKGLIREHGERRRTAALVFSRQPHRIEIYRQKSFAGRGFLYLCDDGRGSTSERRTEIPATCPGVFRQGLPAPGVAAGKGKLFALFGDNPGQDMRDSFDQGRFLMVSNPIQRGGSHKAAKKRRTADRSLDWGEDQGRCNSPPSTFSL